MYVCAYGGAREVGIGLRVFAEVRNSIVAVPWNEGKNGNVVVVMI